MHDYRHGFKVISHDFGVRNGAVPLSRAYAAVPEQILDGNDLGLCVEQLSGHGMAQLMATDSEAGLFRIVLDSFLDAPDRYGIAFEPAFFNEENPLCSRWASDC